MTDGQRAAGRAARAAAALALAVGLWVAARARERARATIPVRADGRAFGPGTVHAVVEGPAGSLLALRLRTPALRAGVRGSTGFPALTPDDVELPAGVRDVRVHEVRVRLPPP